MSADDEAAEPAMSGMSTARGGVSIAAEDLARLSTLPSSSNGTGASGTGGGGEAVGSDGVVGGSRRAYVEEQVTSEFKEFIKKHKKSRKYCPGLTEGKPCAESLRR